MRNPYMVRDVGTAIPEGEWWASGAVAGSLMLDLGVDFGSEEDHKSGDVEPEEENDDAAEGAIHGRIVSEGGDIPGEPDGADPPKHGREDGTWGDPTPFCIFPVGGVAVEERDGGTNHQKEKRPFHQLDDPFGRTPPAEKMQGDRGRGEEGDGQNDGYGQSNGQTESEEFAAKVSPRFTLVVGEIERGDHGVHRLGTAPNRQTEGNEGGPTGRGIVGGDALQLSLKDLEGLGRNESLEGGHLALDISGVSKESVEGDYRSESGDETHEKVEGNSCRDKPEVIPTDPLL